MSESSLKKIVSGALRSVGFRGYHATVYYRGGRVATVAICGACTGVYDIKRGGFVDWRE